MRPLAIVSVLALFGVGAAAGCAAIAGLGSDSDYSFPDASTTTKDSGPTLDSGTAVADSGAASDSSAPACRLTATFDPDASACNDCVAGHCCGEANSCYDAGLGLAVINGCYACVRTDCSVSGGTATCNCSGGASDGEKAAAADLYKCIETTCVGPGQCVGIK